MKGAMYFTHLPIFSFDVRLLLPLSFNICVPGIASCMLIHGRKAGTFFFFLACYAIFGAVWYGFIKESYFWMGLIVLVIIYSWITNSGSSLTMSGADPYREWGEQDQIDSLRRDVERREEERLNRNLAGLRRDELRHEAENRAWHEYQNRLAEARANAEYERRLRNGG